MRPTVSVLIPTTGRRPELLRHVIGGFDCWPTDELEILTIEGHTWGEGLNRLMTQAQGHYWLTCCDDTVPSGTLGAARRMLGDGYMPVQRYFTVESEPVHEFDAAPHGTPLPWSRGYLLTREIYEQVGPFLDASWYVDLDYSERLIAAGWELRACDGYSFTHLDGERDWHTPEVEARERALYEDARAARV